MPSGLVTSLDLHIPPYLKVIPKKWMVVSYRHMKYLELNLVCVNVVSLPVGKQHDIQHDKQHMQFLKGLDNNTE